MIINNNHIRGMYVYDSNAEYEKGDFLISEKDNSIYICIASNPTNKENNTVSGIEPSTDPENFIVYLGDKITTAEEYFNYVNNKEGIDKLISANVLTEILSTYSFGYNEKGIIVETINYSDENLIISKSLSEILGTIGDNTLDSIIKSPILNNAILRISRNLPEIQSKFQTPVVEEGLDKDSVVLRQYTFKNSSNEEELCRVQELVDHITGNILYRYSWGENFINISEWKSSFVNSQFKEEVQYVKNYYENKSRELEEVKRNLLNNFRYREVKFNKSGEVLIQCNLPEEDGYINVSNFSKSNIITIIVQTSTGVNLFKNNSITIDLSDSIGTGSILKYYIDDNNTLTISNPKDTEMTLKVSSGKIINIYYRESGEVL